MATKVICNVAAATVGTAGLCFVGYCAYYVHYKRPNERKLNDQPSEEEGVAVEERNFTTITLLSDRLKSLTSQLISGFTGQGRITNGESGGTVAEEYNCTSVQFFVHDVDDELIDFVKLLFSSTLHAPVTNIEEVQVASTKTETGSKKVFVTIMEYYTAASYFKQTAAAFPDLTRPQVIRSDLNGNIVKDLKCRLVHVDGYAIPINLSVMRPNAMLQPMVYTVTIIMLL
ncbi:Hypothetical protein CINCED_3A016996 [Cinara cedri]|uniref:Uncharacterized protein n=1 Tax=Cinara cedri TaxID=506608 RepID=A0A5E4M858_9HEMI|nr:Hypothetical protein CINCED_3A016996 [Cinara cedri]